MARSPNYPKLNLEEAIELAKRIYQEEHLRVVPKEVVAQELGYKGLNGSSSRLISALKHYELLEEPERDRVRVSDDAMTVFELTKDDSDRAAALRRMAFAPQVLTDLQEHYEGRPPDSDVSIRHYLLRKKFLPQAADEVIRLYRDNLELVADQAPKYTDVVVEDERPEVEAPMQPTEEARLPAVSSRASSYAIEAPTVQQPVTAPAAVLQFQLLGNSRARIELTGDVTQEGLDMLAAILNAQKLAFPKADQLERPAVERSVEQTTIEMPEAE